MEDARRDLRPGRPAAAVTPPMDKAVAGASATRTLDNAVERTGNIGFMYFFPPWTERRNAGKGEL